jgi:hypothetical protein
MALTIIPPLPQRPLAEEVTTASSVPTPPTILRAYASNLDYNAAMSGSYRSFFTGTLTATENFHLLAVDLFSPTASPDPPASQDYNVLGQRIAV